MRAPALAGLAVLGAGELLLARATSGPLSPQDVGVTLVGWAVVMGLTRALPARAVLEVATFAVAAHVLVPPAWGAAGPVGGGLFAVTTALLLPLGRGLRPIVLATLALVTATLLATLFGPSPPAPRLLEALLALVAAALVADRVHFGPVLPAAALVALAPTPRFDDRDPRPDVLVVTVDALRADAAAGMASVQALATGGRDLEGWAPSPWTLPSLAGLHTGVPAHASGTGRVADGAFAGLDPGLPTLAERLRAAGYRTVAISGGNPFTGQRYGLLRGFVETWHPWEPVATPLPRLRAPHAHARPLFARALPDARVTADDADALVDRALTRLRERDRARLLWLHLMDLHLPYLDAPCRPEVLGAPSARRQLLADPWWSTDEGRACLEEGYAAAVARVDRALLRLLTGIDLGRTVVVLTADHGEALGEVGLEHGHTLQPEVTRVPLVVWAPQVDLSLVGGAVALTDIPPTVLSLVGEPPDLPGLDLTTADRAGPTVLSNVLYGPPRRGAVEGPWLLVESDGRERLYRWAAPPDDREVPLDDHAGTLRRLRAWLPEVVTVGEGVEGDAGRLEALGYVE